MGKAGRFACIFTPLLLTQASMICFVLVMLGQTPFKGNNKPPTALGRDLYFFKADTSKFNANPDTILSNLPSELDNNLLTALEGAASAKALKDFYKVGLWSYCEGDKDADGKETITYCSSRKFKFFFDPTEVWELKNTTAQQVLGDGFDKGLKVYKKAAKWMNWSFVITLVLTGIEAGVGIFAIFSRWGSLATTIVSTTQTVFAMVSAICATAIYATLTGVFETALKEYKIDPSMGRQMLITLWLGVAFSIGSGFFWLASVCCCSGKSSNKQAVAEKTPYTYERVSSPAFGQQQQQTAYAGHGGAQHGAQPTAYEPFRAQQHV